MHESTVLAVDIGGTNLRLGFVDEEGGLHGFERFSSRELLNSDNPAEELVSFLVEQIEKSGFAPSAIAVGFPSTVDKDRRTVLSTSNIPGLDNIPFADMMEAATGLPTYVNRDTAFHLLHDVQALGLSDSPTVVGVYLGTGLGSALQVNGELHVGKTGAEGELGHMPVLGNERVCGCGNIGCVETIAGGAYLEEIVEEHFPGTDISEVFVKHEGDEHLVQYIQNVAAPIAASINLLDPDVVVLGGGVPAMPGFPFDALISDVAAHTRKPYPARDVRIVRAQPDQTNAVLGAGIYTFDKERERK